MFSALLLLGSAPVAPALAAEAPAVVRGPARVVDGDTLYVDGKKIRLLGVDAPEKTQSCRCCTQRLASCWLRFVGLVVLSGYVLLIM